MKTRVTCSALLAATYLLVGWAGAADQTILGRSLTVKNPGAADKRKVSSTAKEAPSPNTIVGDPTLSGSAGGALLTVIANGANPSMQAFNLPQGTTLAGKDFWRVSGAAGFKYKDGKGEQGPVRTVMIRKTPSGQFNIKVVIKGKNGPLNVLPPNPGTDGFVTLQLGTGDRYCVQFGADGQVSNKSGQLFKVRRPVFEGCPGGASTTTTTSSTTTSTTMYSSPSRAFLDAPIDLLD
jgi:hypothetical protein